MPIMTNIIEARSSDDIIIYIFIYTVCGMNDICLLQWECSLNIFIETLINNIRYNNSN